MVISLTFYHFNLPDMIAIHLLVEGEVIARTLLDNIINDRRRGLRQQGTQTSGRSSCREEEMHVVRC